MQTLRSLVGVAAETTLSSGDLGGLRSPSSVLHAGTALLLLLAARTLVVYKPRRTGSVNSTNSVRCRSGRAPQNRVQNVAGHVGGALARP
jgi:hypothetical protein